MLSALDAREGERIFLGQVAAAIVADVHSHFVRARKIRVHTRPTATDLPTDPAPLPHPLLLSNLRSLQFSLQQSAKFPVLKDLMHTVANHSDRHIV